MNKFCSSSPPEEKHVNIFPALDEVVNVANCWYYLSLLERFVDITQDMSQEFLKMYLVRAEYRYFKWVSKNLKDRSIELAVPPVDVAFFLQAHMLSPIRYDEDTDIRNAAFRFPNGLPLKKIHEMGIKKDKAVLLEWQKVMKNEPYDLTERDIIDSMSSGSALIPCIECSLPLRSPWIEYSEWRTDHSVALQCQRCEVMLTIKHVGKYNLFADNAVLRKHIAGLHYHGHAVYHTKFLLLPVKDFKWKGFNQGVKPIYEVIQEKKRNDDKQALQVPDPSVRALIEAIKSTYLCTPYRGSSIDLIQAVARQYKFAYKVTKVINWQMPQGIINGIRNYVKFLAVIKDNPELTAVPTIEIDLAWHTHMLHPSTYKEFTLKYISKWLNHDDAISEKDLQVHVKHTETAWKVRGLKERKAKEIGLYDPPVGKPGILGRIGSTLTSNKRDFSKAQNSIRANESHPLYDYRTEKQVFNYKLNYGSHEKAALPKDNSKINSLLFKLKNDSSRSLSAAEVFDDEEIKPRLSDYKERYEYVDEKKDAFIELQEDIKQGKNELQKSKVDIDKIVDFGYDIHQTSFHDKRDIKEFILLNNSDDLMDEEFEDVKFSKYGFIGTSTCANTNYLDQWEIELETGKAIGGMGIVDYEFDEITSNIPKSKYTKVFLTGKTARFTPKGAIISPTKISTTSKGFYKSPFSQTSQSNGVRASDEPFDWYSINIDLPYPDGNDIDRGNNNDTQNDPPCHLTITSSSSDAPSSGCWRDCGDNQGESSFSAVNVSDWGADTASDGFVYGSYPYTSYDGNSGSFSNYASSVGGGGDGEGGNSGGCGGAN